MDPAIEHRWESEWRRARPVRKLDDPAPAVAPKRPSEVFSAAGDLERFLGCVPPARVLCARVRAHFGARASAHLCMTVLNAIARVRI